VIHACQNSVLLPSATCPVFDLFAVALLTKDKSLASEYLAGLTDAGAVYDDVAIQFHAVGNYLLFTVVDPFAVARRLNRVSSEERRVLQAMISPRDHLIMNRDSAGNRITHWTPLLPGERVAIEQSGLHELSRKWHPQYVRELLLRSSTGRDTLRTIDEQNVIIIEREYAYSWTSRDEGKTWSSARGYGSVTRDKPWRLKMDVWQTDLVAAMTLVHEIAHVSQNVYPERMLEGIDREYDAHTAETLFLLDLTEEERQELRKENESLYKRYVVDFTNESQTAPDAAAIKKHVDCVYGPSTPGAPFIHWEDGDLYRIDGYQQRLFW